MSMDSAYSPSPTDASISSLQPGGGDYMRVLKTMDRNQILEILSDGFCSNCQSLLTTRIHNLLIGKGSEILVSCDSHGDTISAMESCSLEPENTLSRSIGTPNSAYATRLKSGSATSSPASVSSRQISSDSNPVSAEKILLNDGLSNVSSPVDNGLSEEQKEQIRFSNVGRKKNFSYIERVNGKSTNILQGLELHTKVFNTEEQKKIVECVYNLQKIGRKGQLRERTYSEPKKWMRGKGRVTLQFGCCYNYSVDQNGNPPGIIRDEEVDPLPPTFKQMIKRLVRWHVLPPNCIPNSCIVNIYDEGDCIPPHIDHHDFVRPFCTVSFLTECNILFGSNLKIVGPGEFSGPASIPLPAGSVLVLNGNGADVAKHCIPGVPARRISITFRKMDDSKHPYKFSPDPELLGVRPLVLNKSPPPLPHQQSPQPQRNGKLKEEKGSENGVSSNSFAIGDDDFPALGSSNYSSRSRANRSGSRK